MEQQWIPSLAPTNTSSTHTDRIFQIGLSSVQGVQVRGINSLQFTKLSLSGLQFPRNNKSSPFPFPQNTQHHRAVVGNGQMETDVAESKVQLHREDWPPPPPQRLLFTEPG